MEVFPSPSLTTALTTETFTASQVFESFLTSARLPSRLEGCARPLTLWLRSSTVGHDDLDENEVDRHPLGHVGRPDQDRFSPAREELSSSAS